MRIINQKLKELDKQKWENRLEEIKNSKSDSSRMTEGFTIIKKEQVAIIAAHFRKQFSKNTQVLNKIHSQPTAMNQPFTAKEMKSAIRSLQNNKS